MLTSNLPRPAFMDLAGFGFVNLRAFLPLGISRQFTNLPSPSKANSARFIIDTEFGRICKRLAVKFEVKFKTRRAV